MNTKEPARGVPAPVAPPPRAGATTVRVRYCECDPMGVAHHAAYIPWLEIGRTELLRRSGVSYAQLEASGVFLVITSLEAKYRRPVLYDDLVEIRTTVASTGRVKIDHRYDLSLVERPAAGGKASSASPGEVLFSAASTLACVGPDGRVRELPDWLRADHQDPR